MSNGKVLLRGVDGRSSAFRRFKDLIRDFAKEFGGYEALSEAHRLLIRQAAAVTLRAEQLQADVVSGSAVNPDELIRLTSEARRCLDTLRRVRPEPRTKQDKLTAALEAARIGGRP